MWEPSRGATHTESQSLLPEAFFDSYRITMSRQTTTSTLTEQHTADVLHLRGEVNAINAHSAHQQPPAPAVGTQQRRADREYPTPYEGGNPGEFVVVEHCWRCAGSAEALSVRLQIGGQKVMCPLIDH